MLIVPKLQHTNMKVCQKKIKSVVTSDNSLAPGMNYIKNTKTWLKLDGTCLKQEKKLLIIKL